MTTETHDRLVQLLHKALTNQADGDLMVIEGYDGTYLPVDGVINLDELADAVIQELELED